MEQILYKRSARIHIWCWGLMLAAWAAGMSGGSRVNAQGIVTPIARDFDGDGKDDPALIVNGDWYAWLSSRNYQPAVLTNTQNTAGGSTAAGDVDGDGRLDGGMASGNFCKYWLSTQNYGLGDGNLGHSGSLIIDDLNLDGKADIFLTTLDSKLFYFSSKLNYAPPQTPFDVINMFGLPGRLVLGYYNEDRILDIGWVSDKTWYWLPSDPGWANMPNFDILSYYFVPIQSFTLDMAGIPFYPDFDGDRRGDPTIYEEASQYWYVWLSSQNLTKYGPFQFVGNLPAFIGSLVLSLTNGTMAVAAVSDGLFDIANANVTVAGTRLEYGMPVEYNTSAGYPVSMVLPLYFAPLAVTPGTPISITATKANGESIYQSAAYPMPGPVQLLEPTNELPFMLGQPIPMRWTPVNDVSLYYASYLALDGGNAGDDAGQYLEMFNPPVDRTIVPVGLIVPGYCQLSVLALSGDLAAVAGEDDPTNSFFLVASYDEQENYVNVPSPPGDLRIASRYSYNYKGLLRFTCRESDPMQIFREGTITIGIKMRRFKLSIAAIEVYDSKGVKYLSWEKSRVFKRQHKYYTVSFAARPYTTVAIITHDASYCGGAWNY